MPNPLPKHIAYFISGHGYGHAVRSVQLINALPDTIFSIFTTIEKNYFEREINQAFDYSHYELDCGCVQTDALEVNIQGTYESYALIEAQRETTISECKQLLLAKNIEFVISDISAIALTIAHQLNLPSLAISNFTWAEIYAEYIPIEPRFQQLLNSIRQDYSNANCFARLKPGLEQHPFHVHEDVGLLCRNKARDRAWLYEQLGLDQSKKLCLVYIGQYGLSETNWQNFSTYSDWQFVGIYPLNKAPENYLQINLEESLIKYTDLVANCDLILAKLGYGSVAESLYWKKPVAYPPRKLFCEFNTLENELNKVGTGFPLSLEQLQNCELGSVLAWAININLKAFEYASAETSIINLISQLHVQHTKESTVP